MLAILNWNMLQEIYQLRLFCVFNIIPLAKGKWIIWCIWSKEVLIYDQRWLHDISRRQNWRVKLCLTIPNISRWYWIVTYYPKGPIEGRICVNCQNTRRCRHNMICCKLLKKFIYCWLFDGIITISWLRRFRLYLVSTLTWLHGLR